MKILYLITSLTPGGAEFTLKKIISHLNSKNFEITVCVITKTFDILDLIKPFVNKIYCLETDKITQVFKALFKLRKIIIKENPDILHCFMIHANIIGRLAAINHRCKVISSVRTKLINRRVINFIDFLSQTLVDIYLVNSKTLAKFIKSYGITKNKIVLIENGVDFKKFKIKNYSEELRHELNLTNLPIITMIANFKKQKDYPTMIRALALLKKDVDFCFLAVGTGLKFEDETNKIKNLVKSFKLDNVKFLGFRDDIPEILAITDIWVSSTLFEGQSNSLLEAMAMKKPIVTTNIDENKEVVRNNQTALIIPIKSPQILAESILKLIKNNELANFLAENAYKRVRKRYDFTKKVDSLLILYFSLVNSK